MGFTFVLASLAHDADTQDRCQPGGCVIDGSPRLASEARRFGGAMRARSDGFAD